MHENISHPENYNFLFGMGGLVIFSANLKFFYAMGGLINSVFGMGGLVIFFYTDLYRRTGCPVN